ncbi:MAG: alpha/beta fold hydrolase, partial [Acidimicrobiia bacterium]
MDLDAGMPEMVAPFMPSSEEVAACRWLTDEDLQFYVQEFGRTGFQGGLQWYRCSFRPEQGRELGQYHGQSIDVPACFIGGERDWGVYQQPGSLESMYTSACSNVTSIDLVDGAGHWVQQERPAEVVRLLRRFLAL